MMIDRLDQCIERYYFVQLKMASMVAKVNCQVSSSVSIQEKGSRNKRKFRADPPLSGDPNKIILSPQNECPSYEFSAELHVFLRQA